VQTWYFSECPYPALPDPDTYDSIRVSLPNKNFDPAVGAGLYDMYLDLWQQADEQGLNVMTNEHHATATCIVPATPLMAAILARTTKKARILILGNPIANRRDPLRIAEEMAMIDVLSKGRLEVGFVRGVPFEVLPANSRPTGMHERMWEAHDLILKAWDEHEGPFSWEGTWHHRYVNIWPRPYQQPRPPVWVTGTSPSSIPPIAQRGHTMACFVTGWDVTKKLYDSYRETYTATNGVECPANRLAYGVQVFVGELAPVGRAPVATGPTAFLRRWLCLDTRFRRSSHGTGCRSFKQIKADGFAHHPYGPTARVPRNRDVINLLAIRRLGDYLDRARAARRFSSRLSIYNTEFGLQSNPPDPFVSTTLSRQAALINEKEEYAYRYSRLKSHSQYLMYDDPARPGPPAVKWSGFQTGLRFASGRAKPSFNAYRFPIVVKRRGRGVRIWGRVRPGSGRRYVRIQRRGGSYGPRLRTNWSGYFGKSIGRSGNFRFRAYDRDGKHIGTSRTAGPIG